MVKVGIWGFGVVGQSIFKYFIKNNNYDNLYVLDKAEPLVFQDDFKKNNVFFTLESEENISSFINNSDKIYVSPGINILKYKQIYPNLENKISSELDIFSNSWKKPIIAITGTLGKTSTVSLLSDILKLSGKKVEVGGNIGTGMIDLLDSQNTSDLAVLELSSFQLDLLNSKSNFKPDIAIWTNLYANHLDRHINFKDYFLAKYKILEYQDDTQKALVNWDLRDNFVALNREIIYFGLNLNIQDIKSLLSLKDKDIVYNLDLQNSRIIKYIKNSEVSKNIKINNLSYPINWLILYIVGEILDLEFDTQSSNLSIPEHRLEFVSRYKNLTFYNDSKATVPESTLAALDYFINNNNKNQSINLFIGGTSKGVNREKFIEEINNKLLAHNCSIRLYCFGGDDAKQLYDWAIKFNLKAEYDVNLDLSFYKCMNSALKDKDNLIVLSPSGASFDLFKDYQDRGKYFKKLVANYIATNKS